MKDADNVESNGVNSMDTINILIKLLSSKRLNLHVEKETQNQIEEEFIKNNIIYEREFKLSEKDIPDFYSSGIVIEVKIKGNAKQIYKQCERYCKFELTKQLILITNRSMGFPKYINNKPCYLINLGKAWL